MCPFFIMPRFITIKNDVARILKATDAYNRIYKDLVLPKDVLEKYTDVLSEFFNCSPETIAFSSVSLSTEPFTYENIYSLLWRLCANKNLLKEDKPVIQYARYMFTNTEEVQFLGVQRKEDRYRTKIRVLTGHYAWGLIKTEFSVRALNRILLFCGFHGRKYQPGRVEECLPGLCAKALLTDSAENPKVFTNIESNDEMCAFNRKNVIGPRLGYVKCPFDKAVGVRRCIRCSVCRDKCFASYKENENV